MIPRRFFIIVCWSVMVHSVIGMQLVPQAKKMVPDVEGRTPLHYAAMDSFYGKYRDPYQKNNYLKNNRTLIKNLLINKASPNAQDYEGNKPLYYACVNQNKKVIELLLQHGGDPAIENNYGIDCNMALDALGNEGYIS